LRYSRVIQHDLIRLIRADEWWEYKLVPILSTFYATALVLHVAVSSLWVSALSLLLAIVPAAVYASVINDVTDLAGDLEAGKRNGLAGRSRSTIAALVALAAGAGLLFGWLWRDDAPLLACYLATWLAFSFYSLPPFRLKERGAAGVVCVAAGEHLFPALVAVFLACRGGHRAVSGAWVASVAVWALAYGLRGIVWHQLTDVDNDRAAGFRTFARRHPRAAPVLGTFVVFPLELGALAAMLWQIGSAWPPAFLVLYVLYAVRSARRWQTAPVIVMPKPRFFIVLHQFYSDLFPVALLITASVRNRRELIVLAAHLLLFPRRVVHAIRLSASIARTAVNASEPHHGGVG
jgi:UbiA prenyltransferase family